MNLWDLNEETVAIYRQGCVLVNEQLGKQLKEVEKAPGLTHSPRMRELILEQIETCLAAMRLLEEQSDAVAEARTRRQQKDPAQTASTQTVEEALNEADDLVKRRRKRLAKQLEAEAPPAEPTPADAAEAAAAGTEPAAEATGEAPAPWVDEDPGEPAEPVLVGGEADAAFEEQLQAAEQAEGGEQLGDPLPPEPAPQGENAVDEYADRVVVYMNAEGTLGADPETGHEFHPSYAESQGFLMIRNGEWFRDYKRNPDGSFEWREKWEYPDTPDIPRWEAPVEPFGPDEVDSGTEPEPVESTPAAAAAPENATEAVEEPKPRRRRRKKQESEAETAS